MQTYMTIVAEKDVAVQERDMAIQELKIVLFEKEEALAERDRAIQERDAAIAEHKLILESYDALNALYFRECSMNDDKSITVSLGNGISPAPKHGHHHLSEAALSTRNVPLSDALSTSAVATGVTKSFRKGRRGAIDARKQVTTSTSSGWKDEHDFGGNGIDSQLDMSELEWETKSDLNKFNFDESTMPAPVCSCTGEVQQCYKWGNGGWQSACCTTKMSMYPLPHVPNKRRARVGGRKMSGSVFSKLLCRLIDDGHNLSAPVDLKNHWGKHGTNRYSTIK